METDHGQTGQAEAPGRRAPVRDAIRRYIVSLVILIALLIKPFKFLHRFLPPRLRELIRSWDVEMMWTVISSRATRIHMDQNCKLKDPPNFKPLVKTKPEWQFSEQEIKSFYDNGFIGPITLWTPEEMAEIRKDIEKVLERPSRVYPTANTLVNAVSAQWRDRYIDCPEYWDIVSSPQIVERLAQFLGPDLLVWRSQIFNKKPGHGAVTWHQGSTYLGEQRVKATLEPADLNQLFQLNTWIAIDDAYFDNGCLVFLKGSHRKIWTIRRGGKGFIGDPPEMAKLIGGQGSFAKASITMEAPITQEMIAPMPLKSGQAVIFTECCIHGSGPNVSKDRRFGLAFRAIRPDCAVYRNEEIHYVNYLNEQFDLANWGCTLLRGEDKYRLNKLVPPPRKAAAFAGAVEGVPVGR